MNNLSSFSFYSLYMTNIPITQPFKLPGVRRTQLPHKALCTLQRGASECPVARWFDSNDLWPREHWNEEKTALSAWPTHRSGLCRQWAGCSDNHWIHGGSVFLKSYRSLKFIICVGHKNPKWINSHQVCKLNLWQWYILKYIVGRWFGISNS